MKKNKLMWAFSLVLLLVVMFANNIKATDEYYPKGTQITYTRTIKGYEIGTKIKYYPRFSNIPKLKSSISIEVNDEEASIETVYVDEYCPVPSHCTPAHLVINNSNNNSEDGKFEIEDEEGLTFSVTFEALDETAIKKSFMALCGDISIFSTNGNSVSGGGSFDEDDKYTTKIIKYPVNYYKNYGNDNVFEKENILENEMFNISDIEFDYPENMEFKEWNTQADGKGVSYKVNQEIAMPSTALNLYAIWTVKETTEKKDEITKDKPDKKKEDKKNPKIPETGSNMLMYSIILLVITILPSIRMYQYTKNK
ncbi:hypothetical protein OKW23_000876 [Bacilli bacterium PM5-9]|nr:hypothetical protein [Bacilli bacterium PM5-9]